MACPPARPTRRAPPRVRTRRIATPAVIRVSAVSGAPAGRRLKHPRAVTGGGSIRSAQPETNPQPAPRDRPPIELTRTEFLGPTGRPCDCPGVPCARTRSCRVARLVSVGNNRGVEVVFDAFHRVGRPSRLLRGGDRRGGRGAAGGTGGDRARGAAAICAEPRR